MKRLPKIDLEDGSSHSEGSFNSSNQYFNMGNSFEVEGAYLNSINPILISGQKPEYDSRHYPNSNVGRLPFLTYADEHYNY